MNNQYMNQVPIGAIAMWSGSYASIPLGWAICDGKNGTPNLIRKFVVGANYRQEGYHNDYSLGANRGKNNVTLTKNELPKHSHNIHSLGISNAGEHTHSIKSKVHPYISSIDSTGTAGNGSRSKVTISYNVASSYSNQYSVSSAGTHSHSLSLKIGNTGSSQSHENRPPYYALYFIMRVKTYQYPIIFKDTFRTNENRWDEKNSCQIENRCLVIKGSSNYSFSKLIPIDTTKQFSITITGKINTNYSDDETNFGIVWGMNNRKSEGFIFGINSMKQEFGSFSIKRGHIYYYTNKNVINWKYSNKINYIKGPNFDSLKIQFLESRVHYFINNNKVATGEFEPFDGQNVALYVKGKESVKFGMIEIKYNE